MKLWRILCGMLSNDSASRSRLSCGAVHVYDVCARCALEQLLASCVRSHEAVPFSFLLVHWRGYKLSTPRAHSPVLPRLACFSVPRSALPDTPIMVQLYCTVYVLGGGVELAGGCISNV